MSFSYDKLWEILNGRSISKVQLRNITGLSSATIAKLGKNENINMKSLEKICEVLKCDLSDVIEYIPKNKR